MVISDKLRPYQIDGVHFLRNKQKCLVYDEMGLGKTVTTLTALEIIWEDKDFNCVIFCPKFALYVWKEEIMKWFGKDSIVYSGTLAKRAKLWESYQGGYLITTYGMLDEIVKLDPNIHGLVADEIHVSGLLNHKSQTYTAFEKFARNIPYVYLLTGTPIRQGVIDLYAPLSMIDKANFKSYWQFVNKYCITIDTPFGKSIERRPKNIESFRNMLKEYMLRRTKDEVLKDLPGKQRQIIYVDMDEEQEKAYNNLVTNMYLELEDSALITPNMMSLILRLRQLLTCPAMLGLKSTGAALEQLIIMGKDLIESGQSFVVFTPFRKVIPHIQEAIHKSMKDIKVYTISGGMTAQKFADEWQEFQKNKSNKKILICVIKSGASFHATEASHAFFLGYEWDFNQNVQSEDRLHRFGQKHFVNIYYFMHRNTVDEDVAQRLNDKQDASNWAIGNEEQYTMLLNRFKINRRQELKLK